MKLQLSPRDGALHQKLYVSATDVAYARQCAQHIKKKGWFRPPWSQGTVYFQQSAFVTALIVSYARPFVIGRAKHHFPERLIPYDADQFRLHKDFLDRRNKVYAHSDSDNWHIQPWRSGDFETTIVSQPWLIVSEAEIDQFLSMTEALLKSIGARQSEILSGY